jgi:hypothetical protein
MLGLSKKSLVMYQFPITRTYRIRRESVLRLEGTSGMGKFTCGCREIFPFQSITFTGHDKDAGMTACDSTHLSINIEKLDCGNVLMNLEMQKALGATDHPYIHIDLLKIMETPPATLSASDAPVKLKALVSIQIKGVARHHWIDVSAKKSAGGGKFRFSGAKNLTMTEFGIEPPVALFGLMKVKDSIRVLFDLQVEVLAGIQQFEA